jgi:hypothetical protein
MPDRILYTSLSPVPNKPVHGLLETGRTIRTKRVAVMTESVIAHPLWGPQTGYFVTTISGSRYTVLVLPVAAFRIWRFA